MVEQVSDSAHTEASGAELVRQLLDQSTQLAAEARSPRPGCSLPARSRFAVQLTTGEATQ